VLEAIILQYTDEVLPPVITPEQWDCGRLPNIQNPGYATGCLLYKTGGFPTRGLEVS